MSRIQLALNVSNLDEAVDFYARFFATPPAKKRPGYANFAIAEPPLKLVLIENPGSGGTINHLGVEVEDRDGVARAHELLARQGFPVDVEEGTDCCYALQDKVWVQGPDRARWEVYAVLAHTDGSGDARAGAGCCVESGSIDATRSGAACC